MEDIYSPRIGLSGTLTEEEKVLTRDVVTRRTHQNEKNKIPNKKMSDKSDEEIDLDGYGAEVFFGRIFGLQVDTSDYCRGGLSDTGDFVLPNGKIVDVKQAPCWGRLFVPYWKKDGKRVDYYALVVGGIHGGYEFKGFATSDDVFRPERLQMIREKTYVTLQRELKELAEIEKKDCPSVSARVE